MSEHGAAFFDKDIEARRGSKILFYLATPTYLQVGHDTYGSFETNQGPVYFGCLHEGSYCFGPY